MNARCAVHAEAESIASCTRCGRFLCASCVDGRRVGWCSDCANRPEVRLEVSPRAKVVFWLAVGSSVVVPLGLLSWWLERRGTFFEADRPLLVGARWLRATFAIAWVAGAALWLQR